MNAFELHIPVTIFGLYTYERADLSTRQLVQFNCYIQSCPKIAPLISVSRKIKIVSCARKLKRWQLPLFFAFNAWGYPGLSLISQTVKRLFTVYGIVKGLFHRYCRRIADCSWTCLIKPSPFASIPTRPCQNAMSCWSRAINVSSQIVFDIDGNRTTFISDNDSVICIWTVSAVRREVYLYDTQNYGKAYCFYIGDSYTPCQLLGEKYTYRWYTQ